MNTQLELPMEDPDEKAGAAEHSAALPSFILTEDSTPAAIVAWWDALVAVFTSAAATAEQQVNPLDAELTALKATRTPAARRRPAVLRTEREHLIARAEAVEFEAYAMFEGALAEFSPRLITLMQAEGLALADDDEMAVAEFWDCLQRPAIEHYADVPLREIVRAFCRECLAP